jgi:hypothetical protein
MRPHKLALDNLYCNGEISDNGLQWTDAAYSTHWSDCTWRIKGGRRGQPEGDVHVSCSGEYLWQNCQPDGVTYRTYGEMVHFAGKTNAIPWAALKPGHKMPAPVRSATFVR